MVSKILQILDWPDDRMVSDLKRYPSRTRIVTILAEVALALFIIITGYIPCIQDKPFLVSYAAICIACGSLGYISTLYLVADYRASGTTVFKAARLWLSGTGRLVARLYSKHPFMSLVVLLVILLALTTGLICLSIADSTFGLGWQVLDRCMMGMWGALCYIAIKFYHETCTHTIHVSASNPAILEAINTLCSKEKEIGEEKVGVMFGIYDTSKERIEMKVRPLSDHLNEPTDTENANGTAN